MMSSNQNMWSVVTQLRTVSSNREREYNEFDRMEQDVLISSALEIYADEATQQNDRGEIAWVESSDDPELAEELNDKIDDFEVKDKIWSWAYSLAKKGEIYEELFDAENNGNGEEGATGLSDYTETVEDTHKVFNLKKRGKTINFAKIDDNENMMQSGKQKCKFYDPYKFVHFCMTASEKTEQITLKKDDGEETTYKIKRGRGILENIITSYRILRLLENAMITSRLSRSYILRLFQLEVGEKSPKKVRDMVRRFRNLIGMQENFDIESGLYQTQNNPGPMINPIVIPTKNNVGSVNVQEYGGNTDVHGITDIDYFRNKVFAGLKVTKAFLGWEECLRKDTEITFLDGTTKTIGEIAENKDKYIGKGILSCNTDGEIVPTKIIHAKKTRKDAEFVRVHLDNGKYVDATPDHPFMLRDGSFKDAGELKEDDRLMPLYSKIKRGRRYIKDNKTNEWKLQKDLGIKTEDKRAFDLKELSEAVNHKVVKVEKLDIIEDAYDIGVENESHTFGLMNAGIFVHNSLPGGLGNATLTKLDVRFARTVKRVVKALEDGIQDLLNIYLIKNGREGEVNKFKVIVHPPTSFEELERVEELSEKMRVVDSVVQLFDRYTDEANMEAVIEFLIDRILKYPDLKKAAFYSEEDEDNDNNEDNEDNEDDGGGFRGR